MKQDPKSRPITLYDNPRRRVNILNGSDYLACMLGELGWGTDAIARATGLTKFQVVYRLGLGHVKRATYRNGESEAARRVLLFAKKSLSPVIEKNLIKAVREDEKKRREAQQGEPRDQAAA